MKTINSNTGIKVNQNTNLKIFTVVNCSPIYRLSHTNLLFLSSNNYYFSCLNLSLFISLDLYYSLLIYLRLCTIFPVACTIYILFNLSLFLSLICIIYCLPLYFCTNVEIIRAVVSPTSDQICINYSHI